MFYRSRLLRQRNTYHLIAHCGLHTSFLRLSGFYQSRVFLSGSMHAIFSNANAKKKKKKQNACCQMISVFLLRKYAWSVKAALYRVGRK